MKKHLGSTIALIIGALSLISGLTNPGSLLVAGSVIILGALAYRSAKKRWLDEAKQSLLRKSLEATAMIAIVAVVLLQNNVAALIVSDPVPNLIIPLWAVIAYSIIALKSLNQPITRQHENKWLARAFVVTSLIGFTLYAGLLIRAVVIDGNIAYALGGLLLPSIITYAAISKRRAPTKTITLVVAIAISSLIAIAGFQSWNEIVVANKLAEVVQQHHNDVKLLTQVSSTPTESSASTHTSEQLQPPTKFPLQSRSLSESEMLEFMTTLIRESSERQMLKGKERLAELSQLGLEEIYEPANLLSATGIKEGQRRIAAYQALLSKMEADYDAEVNWQDEKVLSVAGTDAQNKFRQGRASNQNDTKSIYRLQQASAVTSNELLSFFDRQVKQQTVSIQDGQFTFANQTDIEKFNLLIQQLGDQEKQIADLQKNSLLRRENAVEEMLKEAGQQ